MNGLSGRPIPIVGQILLAIITLAVLALIFLHAVEIWNRWQQHRFVAKIRREHHRKCQIKARVIATGAVYDFQLTPGIPTGKFALCDCWRFDASNGSLPYSFDGEGVQRTFGYNRDEIVYIAEHASEFVGATPLP